MGLWGWGRGQRFLCLVFVLSFASPVWADFHRVVYADDPSLVRFGRRELERAYGARLLVIPPNGSPPATPRRVEGTVIHIDPEYDSKWVLGERNPMLEFQAIAERIQRDFPGIVDINDKWDEYRFLKLVSPELAPPETRLASEFVPEVLGAVERDEVLRLVRARMAGFDPAIQRLGLDRTKLEADLFRLEAIRRLAHAVLGKSIVKQRAASYSEGRLPWTHKDWLDLYLGYVTETKPRIREIEREIEGTSRSLPYLIVDLPHIEGRTLEAILESPSEVVIQKGVKILTEVRLHIVNGKILDDATFLRFYELGRYLKTEDKAAIHQAVREHFLAGLGRRGYPDFASSSDVAIIEQEDGSRRISILDLNGDYQSGYFYPEEDLFTTNRLAQAMGSERVPFIDDFNRYRGHRMGSREKRLLLKKLVARSRKFLEGDVLEAFWGRIFAHYMGELAKSPTGAHFETALFELREAGLRSAFDYYGFIVQVQETWPELTLPERSQGIWAAYLMKLDPKLVVRIDGGHLVAEYSCAKALTSVSH